jgi:hypothetical protein
LVRKEVNTRFDLWYTGSTANKNGGFLIDKRLKTGAVDVRRQIDRVTLVKLVMSDSVLNVISTYTLQIGHDESVKRLLERLRWHG